MKMKKMDCSALWDDIIERYCNTAEKKIIGNLPSSEYTLLEILFDDFISVIKRKSVKKN